MWSLPGSAPLAQNGADRVAARVTAEAELLQLDQQLADAVVRGDTAYVERMTAADFVMTHGDGWTHGGQPLLTDAKPQLLQRTASRYYDVLDFDSVRVETHGDIAITQGRYIAHANGGNPDRAWFSVWFERVYARRDGRWLYLSHRTVHGPTFGPDRESIHDQ
jgi:hypothetical protein